jgi:hypothetical protein
MAYRDHTHAADTETATNGSMKAEGSAVTGLSGVTSTILKVTCHVA